jgi:hypothetical protein
MGERAAVALTTMLLLLGAGSARAAGPDLEYCTGDELFTQCSAAPADADYQPRQARCVGYVLGASDAEQAAQGAGAALSVCITPSTGAQALADAVRRFLEAHPEKRHLAAQDLVREALAASYPCK